MLYDLLIQRGTVLDPASCLEGSYDILVNDGRIVGLYESRTRNEAIRAKTVVDATGLLVTPGLIDIHTHVFSGYTHHGIQPDLVGINQGVTTVVDAGSAGVRKFAAFITEIVEKNETEVLSWLNIASDGLCASRSELADSSGIESELTEELIKSNKLIRGVKVRMSSSVLGLSGIKPLEIAKKVALNANVPLMVHVGNGPPELGDILDLLEAGDVVTHAFHGKRGGIFSVEQELIPQARKALQRGVRFDVGHGTSSFNFKTASMAKMAGVTPFTISTDLYLGNYHGPVYSLATTLSKFLALGFSLTEVLKAVTSAPAAVLGLSDRLGALAVGRIADISILELIDGEFEFIDAEKNRMIGQQMLQPKYVIHSGKVWKCT